MNQVNERTNRRTNRQLVREGRGKSSGARKRLRGARPRKGLASCNYGASATPALSPIIRMRFQVRLSDPLGVRGPRESHREASRPKRPYKPRRYGARKEEKMQRERERERRIKRERKRVEHRRSIMWRLPSDTDRFHRFGAVSGLALRPQKLCDQNGRMPCGEHREESQDMTISKYLNQHLKFTAQSLKFLTTMKNSFRKYLNK